MQPLTERDIQRDHGVSGRHEARDIRPGNRVRVRGPANDGHRVAAVDPSALTQLRRVSELVPPTIPSAGPGRSEPAREELDNLGIPHVRHASVLRRHVRVDASSVVARAVRLPKPVRELRLRRCRG